MKDTKLRPYLTLFNEEVITAIDLEFCRFLHKISPDIGDDILLGACLTSMAYQHGDVCIQLNDYSGRKVFMEGPEDTHLAAPKQKSWIHSLNNSLVVGSPGDFKPLILDGSGRLYFHRLWKLEQRIGQQILVRINQSAPEIDSALLKNGIGRLFEYTEDSNWQKVACTIAIQNLFTVISGGPGTGKTTTVVRFLVLLLEQARRQKVMPSIALAAPTGKAAARLQESIAESKASLQTDTKIKASIPLEVVTIHQLMGARRHTAQFRYSEENPLPYDCVIIDEVSMVDQRLMSRLINALRPQTRLLMLGDKNQLASVEAGSVLGDICGENDRNRFSKVKKEQLQKLDINLPEECIISEPFALTDHIVLLKKSYRFDDKSGIGRLSEAIKQGDAETSWSLLCSTEFPEISTALINDYEQMEDILFNPAIEQYKKASIVHDPQQIIEQYNTFKILAAHRKGPWGVQFINNQIEQKLRTQGIISPYSPWYKARPIIINKNDYATGVSNGDLGICLPGTDDFKVCFMNADGIHNVSPSRLPQHSTAFALTVHKSQGSEFDYILLVLPDQLSPLVCRELLYTAVSRARRQVKIVGTEKIIRWAINNNITRNSGLKDYLWHL